MSLAPSVVKRLAVLGFLALGCARAPTRPSPAPRPALPPPSSILVVVAHRDEMELDDGQVAQLLALQKQLERQDKESREKLTSGAVSRASQRALGDSPPGHRRGGGGFGGGRRGGEPPRRSEQPLDREEALAQAFADNDTQILLQAEKVFTAMQWERAKAIAEKYRMEYADRREALKQGAPPQAR